MCIYFKYLKLTYLWTNWECSPVCFNLQNQEDLHIVTRQGSTDWECLLAPSFLSCTLKFKLRKR